MQHGLEVVTVVSEQREVVKHSGAGHASVATVAVVEDEVVVYSLSAVNWGCLGGC